MSLSERKKPKKKKNATVFGTQSCQGHNNAFELRGTQSNACVVCKRWNVNIVVFGLEAWCWHLEFF